MSIICCYCGDDIDAKYQDNMSNVCGSPKCEDCYNSHKKDNSKKLCYSPDDARSNCCGVPIEEDITDICNRCGEHCEVVYD